MRLLKVREKVQFIAFIVLLKDNSKIKGIIPVSKSNPNPQESSSGFFESNRIPSGTVLSFGDSLFVVGRNLSLCEYFAGFVEKGDFDDFIFFSDFDAALPEHLLPVIEVVAFGLGEGGDLEDGDTLFFVAVG